MNKNISIKGITSIIFLFIILSLTSMKMDEFDVWISGKGIDLSIPIETGVTYTYRLERTIGYPSELVKDIIWTVSKGAIKGANTGVLSVDVVWDKNETYGTITTSHVFKDEKNPSVVITKTVSLKTTPTPPSFTPTLSISTDQPAQYIPFNCTISYASSGKEAESITWQVDNAIIINGQGTNTISAYFCSSGTQTIKCKLKLKGDSNTYSASKTINVMPDYTKIWGPDIVCPNTNSAFVLQNMPIGYQVNWIVTEGLSIISGQNSTTVTVKSIGIPNYSTLTAKITKDGVLIFSLTLKIRTNTPFIETVTGPTSLKIGETVAFYAYPEYSDGVCDYEWIVAPSTGVTIDTRSGRNIATILFSQPGSYRVGCREINNSCGTPHAPVFINVYVGYMYSVTTSAYSSLITISQNIENDKNKINGSQSISCELYNASTGILVKKEFIKPDKGTLDAFNIQKGVYILKIQTNENNIETHKIYLE